MPPLVGNLQSVNQMPIFQSVALRESAVFLPRLERGTHVCGGEPFFFGSAWRTRGDGPEYTMDQRFAEQVPPHAWGWSSTEERSPSPGTVNGVLISTFQGAAKKCLGGAFFT